MQIPLNLKAINVFNRSCSYKKSATFRHSNAKISHFNFKNYQGQFGGLEIQSTDVWVTDDMKIQCL